MNAHNHAFTDPSPNWYRKSGIIPCTTCDGLGSYWNGRGLGGNDPDSWDIECEDCDGTGHHACAVCGYDTPLAGYDCYPCDSINSLADSDLAKVDPAALAEAFTRSIAAAKVSA